jgi:hypothetical protein
MFRYNCMCTNRHLKVNCRCHRMSSGIDRQQSNQRLFGQKGATDKMHYQYDVSTQFFTWAGTNLSKSRQEPIWRTRQATLWVRVVTMVLSDRELKRLRWSKDRGCPFGEET